MRLTHKQKVKLARRHRTKAEIKNKTTLFSTAWWVARGERKKNEVLKREANQKEASRLRKARKKSETDTHN